jgi:hypothetical protein
VRKKEKAGKEPFFNFIMAEIESTQENLISDFTLEDVDVVVADEKSNHVEEIKTAPLIDIEPSNEVEESTETLPTLTQTSSGVEEVNCPDINEDTDEAIVDGFPAQTKPQMNGTPTAAPSLPTPTASPAEGFEELTGIDDKCNTDRKDDTFKSPLALWIKEQNLHPQVIRLIYWVELQRTTGVFGGVLLLLLALRFYPLIGVVMTFALSLLVVAFLYRIGMTIVKAVQKTSAEHPFKHLLEEKIEISEESMQFWSSKARVSINEGIRQTQSLFLVKDTVASLKAMIIFWLTSYIASCIYFLTLCIIGTVVVFTVPKLYEEKQNEIDQVFTLAMEKSSLLCGMIEAKLPEKVKVYLKKAKCD